MTSSRPYRLIIAKMPCSAPPSIRCTSGHGAVPPDREARAADASRFPSTCIPGVLREQRDGRAQVSRRARTHSGDRVERTSAGRPRGVARLGRRRGRSAHRWFRSN